MLRLPRAVAHFATAVSAVSFAVTSATPALAETIKIDAADTAWMITATALVLMMTIPGLALFYAGMVRKKNVLATMAQSLIAVALISLLWVIYGYSLVFAGDGAWLGTLERFLLAGHDDGRRQQCGKDHSGSAVRDLPDDLCGHHRRAGGGIGRPTACAFHPTSCFASAGLHLCTSRWRTGSGAAAFSRRPACSISPAALWFISAPGTAGLVAAVVMGRRRGYGTENLAPYDHFCSR